MRKDAVIQNSNFPFKRIADLLGNNQKTCIIGDGLSNEFAIPHFRDVLTGVWSDLTPYSRVNPFESPEHYALVMNWFDCRRNIIRLVKPAEGFKALKIMQHIDPQFSIATQCVDGLLNLNQVGNSLDLYGNVFHARCRECAHAFPSWPELQAVGQFPACGHCGKAIYPDVEMFGWNRKTEIRHTLLESIEGSNTLILIGADLSRAPFDEIEEGHLASLSVIEVLNDGILLKDRLITYRVSLNEIEKYIETRLTQQNEWSLAKAMGYLSHLCGE